MLKIRRLCSKKARPKLPDNRPNSLSRSIHFPSPPESLPLELNSIFGSIRTGLNRSLPTRMTRDTSRSRCGIPPNGLRKPSPVPSMRAALSSPLVVSSIVRSISFFPDVTHRRRVNKDLIKEVQPAGGPSMLCTESEASCVSRRQISSSVGNFVVPDHLLSVPAFCRTPHAAYAFSATAKPLKKATPSTER